MTAGAVIGINSADDFFRKAKAWEVRPAWHQTECEVLVAGVSCADQETRSTCGGYKLGSMPSGSPPVFLTEEIAVCPGTYWCGKEQDMCSCTGEITYAPELFDGEVYTVPSAERAYKVTSSGAHRCGTDQSGQPYAVDPAPWHIKHCWCTPEGILNILKQHHGTSLHKKECSQSANFDFANVPRRLQSEEGADSLEGEEAEPRLLASSRRRRTYSYTPWALVSVSKTENLDFGYGADPSSSHRQLSCAYEYGVPIASSTNYHSDGSYAGDVWKAEDVAKQWGNKTSRTCWVRTTGEAGESLQMCAIALKEPGTLKEVARGSQDYLHKWLLWAIGICLPFTAFFLYQVYRLMRRIWLAAFGLSKFVHLSTRTTTERNPRIYDGSKFRLHSVAWVDGVLQVNLGLTGYKEYLGTHQRPPTESQQLGEDGLRDFGDKAAHFSQALGCEAVLGTSDGQAVLLRRSGAVGTNSGLYNGPSGHPEPKNAGVEAEADMDTASEASKRELFGSVVDEVVAETNVPRESLTCPELIGFMADSTGKPDVLFLLRTSLTSEEVKLAYAKGAEEAWESDRLMFWPLEKLQECDLPLTAVTRAAIACLQLLKAPA
ncbi:Nudt22 [Symbiodinium pilosum]|uniref:Nudt22 protein n=1 Tax=Symbiodinium pilosum TaxID=2952 RepID=A0A812M861_SYMPI|nr:Nudt22 [Symbiodinium pilosum]